MKINWSQMYGSSIIAYNSVHYCCQDLHKVKNTSVTFDVAHREISSTKLALSRSQGKRFLQTNGYRLMDTDRTQ